MRIRKVFINTTEVMVIDQAGKGLGMDDARALVKSLRKAGIPITISQGNIELPEDADARSQEIEKQMKAVIAALPYPVGPDNKPAAAVELLASQLDEISRDAGKTYEILKKEQARNAWADGAVGAWDDMADDSRAWIREHHYALARALDSARRPGDTTDTLTDGRQVNYGEPESLVDGQGYIEPESRAQPRPTGRHAQPSRSRLSVNGDTTIEPVGEPVAPDVEIRHVHPPEFCRVKNCIACAYMQGE